MAITFFQFTVSNWHKNSLEEQICVLHYSRTLADAMKMLNSWEDKTEEQHPIEDGVDYEGIDGKTHYQYHQSFVNDKGQAVIRLQQERADLKDGRLNDLQVRYVSITEINLD